MAENNQEQSTSSTAKPEEEEELVDFRDLIKEEDEMMEEVAAVLGAGDDFSCSYVQGYLKRQALYACLTCLPESKTDYTKSAGFCLACSYYCHDGHELVELYTKRNFRCDCGNGRFGSFICNLHASKDTNNITNQYNQNFSGVYCTCSKPYPDPEDPVEDEMIQCIMCEDWYHTRHLDSKVPKDFGEMICVACIKKNEFLGHYAGLAITLLQMEDSNNEDAKINVTETTTEETKKVVEVVESNVTNEVSEISPEVNGTEKPIEEPLKDLSEVLVKDQEPSTSQGSTSEIKIVSIQDGVTMEENPVVCKKPTNSLEKPMTIFMKDLNWRTQLCKCSDCMKIYQDSKAEFLLDLEDTVQFYEVKGKQKWTEIKTKAQQEEEKMLKSLPRVPALEMIAGINDFKKQLGTYLQSFAEQQKVLTVADVHEFFSNLKENYNKKRKVEYTHFCR